MSIEGDNIDHDLTVEDLLLLIYKEIKLLNARIEDGIETGITEDESDDT